MNLLKMIFGGGRNVITETAEVFMENTEAGAQRRADYAQSALGQFGAEFPVERKGWFDRFMDGLNRLPRPLIVIAVFSLFASSMFDPLWFAERMQGLTLVPDPLWWLAGTIVAFYFGGRFQMKSQEFSQAIAQSTARLPQVLQNITQIRALRHDTPGAAETGTDTALSQMAIEPSDNEAVRAWHEGSK
ncbi:holin family protein [Parasedimentitalea psychrophila]|uniref:Holin family protein n=1 Tax=Parasedimentitalea psychrophila TaxID=2997337 RepID=A0A9Y2KZ92_9RHOB|nr:holin family protein [Parasedimentitalea psychrophila]WIY25045.1 holin family protein [Parasedimentitalea psychrophila]